MRLTTDETFFAALADEAVSGYPLTAGELTVLATHWWDVLLDLDIFLTLSGCYGGGEARDCRYANERLDHLESRLSPEEFGRVRDEVKARWKNAFIEEVWTAYQEGRALWQEEAAAEDEARQKERRCSPGKPDPVATPTGENGAHLTLTNHDRAQRFAALLSQYPDDERTNLIDLIADALHWCRQNGEDMDEILRIAGMHFEAEVDGGG